MATGQVLFQRFYYSKSFVKHDAEVSTRHVQNCKRPFAAISYNTKKFFKCSYISEDRIITQIQCLKHSMIFTWPRPSYTLHVPSFPFMYFLLIFTLSRDVHFELSFSLDCGYS